MRINSLSLENFRNHQKLNLNFVGPTTTIIGRNGRGKTNIVEAVNYFATLGSHRVATDQPLIKNKETTAEVTGVFEKHNRIATVKIAINSTGQNKVFLNGSPLTKPRDLLGLVNTVIFSPEDLDLVKGDPSVRRKYLDDFSVLLSPKFAGVRSDYERVLKQRNTLLKSAGRRALTTSAQETLTAWNEQLIKFGSEIVIQRLTALDKLAPFIKQHGATLSAENEPLEVNYIAKWFTNKEDLTQQFTQALIEKQNEELDRGITLVGPHRDEIELKLSGMPAKGYASHGQSWSIALAMRLATFNVLREQDDDPILILDDVFAELDQRRRSRLLAAISGVEQTLITAAVAEDLPEGLAGEQILLEDN